MPYIRPTKDRRVRIYPHSDDFAKNEGELNYQISCLFDNYLAMNGFDYPHMGDCVGAAVNAVVEFQRRVMAPYEDVKLLENGEVYLLIEDQLAEVYERRGLLFDQKRKSLDEQFEE